MESDAAAGRHVLRTEAGALRIATKRVDLVNASEPLPTVFLVI